MFSRYRNRLLLLQAVGIISIFRRSISVRLMTAFIGMAAALPLHAQMPWTHSGLPGRAAMMLRVDARGGILAAGDSGIFRSTDDGRTWNAGGISRHIYDIAINADGLGLALFTQPTGSNDGLARSTDWGMTWTSIPFIGRAHGIAMDHNGVPILIRSSSLSRSSDQGATWVELAGGGFTQEFFDFYPITFGPDNEFMLGNWGITGGLVFGSGDEGASWFQVYDAGADMAVLEYSPAGTLFVASAGQFTRSLDGGSTWTVVTGIGGNATAMAFQGGDIYVQAHGIYRSTDEGATWSLVGNLPALPGNQRPTAFAVAGNGELLLGTNDGLQRLGSAASVDDRRNGDPPLSIYPNPARDQVSIALPSMPMARCRVRVLDLLGNEVATIVDGEERGGQTLLWNAGGAAPGAYLISVEMGSITETRVITVMR
ncbi:MAG: hypothetical protein JWQ98_2544 [Chlorobi bacterium]|nr:hypothetical protein [Chlorobiota bacterium]